MSEETVQQNRARYVQSGFETLQNPSDRQFWVVFDELSTLPPTYHVAIEQFREGLHSPHQFIQVVSAGNVARFAKDADWALPELEGLLKREPHDVLLVSATAHAIQSLRTPEAAAVLASAVDRALESDIPGHQKGELVTFLLRSVVSMGLVAHDQRGVFRRAVDYFAKQRDSVWTPECLWELDMYCQASANDLHDILSKDPTVPLTDEVLIGYRVRTLPTLRNRTFGEWGVLMDEYCKFSSCGLPERFAFLEEACYADDSKGQNLGLARVVVLEDRAGMRAVCLCGDEAGVGPVAWYPEVAVSMLHRTLKLDPSSTHTLTYHLTDATDGIRGTLVLRESPIYKTMTPKDVFGEALSDLQRFFYEGGKLPQSAIKSSQTLRQRG
jgi:hypothetical protein